MKKCLVGMLVAISLPSIAEAQLPNVLSQLSPQGQQLVLAVQRDYKFRFARLVVQPGQTTYLDPSDPDFKRVADDARACDMNLVDGIRYGRITTPYNAAMMKAKCLKSRTDAEGLELDVQLWGPPQQ